MRRRTARYELMLSLGLLFVVFAIGLRVFTRVEAAIAPNPVAAAWERARTSGSYRFAADVVQTTIPSATIANVGRSSREDRLRLEGQTDLVNQVMQLQLWTQGGSVLQETSGVAVRVERGKTFIRQGSDAWRESQSFADALAPQGDFLSYLAAVRGIQAQPPESRAGLNFTRYSFSIDGPGFAAFIRDRMAEALRSRGELPPGVQLDLPASFSNMSGRGELWVAENGLPLRQTLELSFPEQRDEQVHARIRVDFSDFGLGERHAAAGASWHSRWDFLSWLAAGSAFVLPVALVFGFGVLLLRFRHARLLRCGLALGLSAILVGEPLLRGVRTQSFFVAQTALAAEQEQARLQHEASLAWREQQARSQFDPFADPLVTAAGQAAGATVPAPGAAGPVELALPAARQMPDRAASVPVASAANLAAAPQLAVPATVLAVDSGLDRDRDGLSDFVEQRIGTDPAAADSDGDTITDTLEVEGFVFEGRTWRSDPLQLDSDRDGVADTLEWFGDADGNGLPDDTDGDKVPDLFDADNDGDGVPDRLDLAPFFVPERSGLRSSFDEQTPFSLRLDNLTPGTTAFVDIQLRPTDPEHLWFAHNVLDWPKDQVAQIQDGDGKTFADVAAQEGRQPEANESFGDLKLVPMLEIRTDQAPTHLPSQDELLPFNIIVQDFTADGSRKVVYVPLGIIADEQSGERVAFSARMPYRVAATAWGQPHEVRLVWAVQMLADICAESQNGVCTSYETRNQAQVVQTYYDEWSLTGFNLREDHGTSMAIIYEDPVVDAGDLGDDKAIWALANGLEHSFLAGRDQDGDGRRDVDLDEIVRRFDHPANNGVSAEQRWGLTDTPTQTLDVLRVEKQEYPYLDLAVMTTAMTETSKVLNQAFAGVWRQNPQLKPLLLYAREERFRAVSIDGAALLDGYMTLRDNALFVDMRPADKETISLDTLAGLKWTAYCADQERGGTPDWVDCAQDEYALELERRYGQNPISPDTTPEQGRGALLLAQLYFLSLGQGAGQIVQKGTTPQQAGLGGTLRTDAATEDSVRDGVDQGPRFVIAVVREMVGSQFDDASLLTTFLGRQFAAAIDGAPEAIEAAQEFLKLSKLSQATQIVQSAMILVSALAIGIATILKFIPAGSPQVQRDLNIASRVLFAAVSLYFQTIKPILDSINAVRATIAAAAKLGVTLSIGAAVKQSMLGSSILKESFKISTIIGVVVGLLQIWGFFVYQAVSSKLNAFGPEFNRLFAEAIAATILLLVTTVISLTIVGAIILAIVAVIDIILTAICESGVEELRTVPGLGGACFSLGAGATKIIAKLIYSFDSMVDLERPDLVVPGVPEVKLANPAQGFVAGNPLLLTLPVTSTVVHKNPAPENLFHILPYLWFFSPDNLRSSSVRYSLSRPAGEGVTATLDQMRDDWKVAEHHKFAATPMFSGTASTKLTLAPTTLPVGLNQSLDFNLNMGYALPAYECWTIPNPLPPFFPPGFPLCYTRSVEGGSSNPIQLLKFDSLPPTLDAFMQRVDKGNGGLGLAWDRAFPALQDADGDGLTSGAFGGLDPNDKIWDADGDGLSDAFELERRSDGVAFSPLFRDSDNDGLSDAQEMTAGSHPARADTDNDGLKDSEEVFHQRLDLGGGRPATPQFAGGWDLVFTRTLVLSGTTPVTRNEAISLTVFSDPTLADSDGDGIRDGAERQLGELRLLDREGKPFHPRVANANPLIVRGETDDLDGFVGPGQTLAYTATVNAEVPLAGGALELRMPAALGGGTPLLPLDLADGQVQARQDLSVDSAAASQALVLSSTARVRLPDQGGPALAWQPPTLDNSFSGFTTAARAVDAAASRPDRQDSYLLAALLSNSSALLGRGDVRALDLVGAQEQAIEGDDNNRRALRGTTTPEVVCADNGNCFVVWDHFSACNTVTIDRVRVTERNDPNGADLAIFLVADPGDTNPRDGGYQLLWFAKDINNDQPTAGNLGITLPLSRSFCGESGARIEVWEFDGIINTDTLNNPAATEWDKMHRLGDAPIKSNVFRAGEVQFSAPTSADQPNGGRITAFVPISVPDMQLFDVAGRVVGADTRPRSNTIRISNGLTSSQDDFRPVVASDGDSFLVAWVRLRDGRGSAQILVQRFANTGAVLSAPLVVKTLRNLNAGGLKDIARQVALDLVWVGSHYRLVWKAEGTTSTGSTVIEQAEINRNGALITGSLRQAANDANPVGGSPRIAYDPINQRSLLVYAARGLIKGILQPAGSDSRTAITLVNTAFEPRLAYHPATQGWLLSWLSGFRAQGYAALSADARTVLTSGASVPADGIDGSQQERIIWPIETGTSDGLGLACPAVQAVPEIDLRFEELPGATVFRDGSGFGRDASCVDGNCPQAGAAGAPAAPNSDFALRFDGRDDSLAITHTVQSDLALAFWINTTQLQSQTAGLVDLADNFGVVLRDGRLQLATGDPATTISSDLVADGQWHFVVATRQRNGQIALYLDGKLVGQRSGLAPAATQAQLHVGRLRSGGGFYQGDLDHLSSYGVALSPTTVEQLFKREQQSFCVAAAPAGATVPLARLALEQRDLNGALLLADSALNLTLDADPPRSTVTSLVDGAYVKGQPGVAQTLIIGGSADDDGSGLAQVDISVNGQLQRAVGLATWTAPLTLTEGTYTIRSRAVDKVGNSETPGTGISFSVDATPPQLTLDAPGAVLKAERSVSGTWSVTLGGLVADPNIGTQPGSGVDPESLEVLLEGTSDGPQGNGVQAATLNGNRWSIRYDLPANMIEPSGVYTVVVRAADRVGNQAAGSPIQVRLDTAGPEVALDVADATTTLITNTLTIGGLISDTTGVAELALAFVPIDAVVALSETLLVLRLDEPAGAVYFADDTVQRNDAHCAGRPCPAAGAQGRIDGALAFDGSARLRIPGSASLDFGADQSFSLQGWLNTRQSGTLLARREAQGQGYALEIGGDGRATLRLNGQTLAGGPDLRDGAWHQLAGVLDRAAGQAMLYVDGVRVATAPFSGNLQAAADLELGAGLVGLLDQIVVHGRALGDQEVQALFLAADTRRVPASLVNAGAAASAWSATVPEGLEGYFQLDLYAVDTAGNASLSANLWRGVIDTRAPRLAMRATPSGATFNDLATGAPRIGVRYRYVAEDQHLDEAQFSGPCPAPATRSDFEDAFWLQELFPDLAIRNTLLASCTIWEPSPALSRTVRACDVYGHCAVTSSRPGSQENAGAPAIQAISQAVASPLPHAVVISPTEGSVVAANRAVSVTLAAESALGLQQVVLSLDGADAAILGLNQSQPITRIQRTLSVTPTGEGQHVLTARAVDRAGNQQAVTFPVTFTLDTQPPTVTLETTLLQADDTLQVGSGIVQLGGKVSDTLGIAAVQVQVGIGGFVDATFANGTWRAAIYLGTESFGQRYRITVRAIDLAGRVAETSDQVQVDIADPLPVDPAALPDTTISERPASLVTGNSSRFGFTGSDSTTPAGLRFECRLNGGVFTPCSSPLEYTNLASGNYSFEVRSVDAEGNVDPTPASATWSVATSCANASPTIIGTPGDDVIFGTRGPDIIAGLGGNDRINGLEGDDLICGGGGDDLIEAGHGDDVVEGGDGRDRIRGENGADRLSGDAGDDLIDGDAGDDLIDGGAGNDVIEAGRNDDVVRGGEGNDDLEGDDGNDTLHGDAGKDRIKGDAGHDRLVGGPDADHFDGGAGDDTLVDFNRVEGDSGQS